MQKGVEKGDHMNATQIVAQHIVNTSFEDLPDYAVERAKIRILDSVGTLAAGYRAPGIDGALEYFKAMGGAAESTVLCYGEKLPAANAAFVNALMLRSFDMECVVGELPDGSTEPFHLIGSSFPASLAMSEKINASGSELITALVLGDDLAARLNRGTGFSFDAGWDNTGTINVIGAAAIASKLLKLDVEHTVYAMGIALNLAGGTMRGVNEGTMTFKFHHGKSAWGGIFAAELAKRGFTSEADPLCGTFGYFKLFGGEGVNPATVTDNLGGFYSGDCIVKPYPGCRLVHQPVQVVIELMAENDITSEDVDKIVLHMSDPARLVDKPFVTGPVPQLDGLFNVRYGVAVAAVEGCLLPSHHSIEYHQKPEIVRLSKATDVMYDYSQEDDLSCDVDLVLKDGRTLSRHILQAKGSMSYTPLTREELMEKFWNNVQYCGVLDEENMREAVSIIDSLETTESIASLTGLLNSSAK